MNYLHEMSLLAVQMVGESMVHNLHPVKLAEVRCRLKREEKSVTTRNQLDFGFACFE